MLRAIFCGIGISLLILGAECFIVDQAVLAVPPSRQENATAHFAVEQQQAAPITQTRKWTPPEWAPWTLISLGVVLVLSTAGSVTKPD